MKVTTTVLLAIVSVVTALPQGKAAQPDEDNFRFVGRVNPETRELTWPSTGVIFTFEGTRASINIRNVTGTTSADLTIDGGEPILIANVEGDSIDTPSLPDGTHTVELRKRSETYFGTFRVKDVTTDGQFLSPPDPKRRIEVIGDSHSVGYGLDGIFPCTDSALVQNNPKTYGAVTARALEADYSVVAWSGKGLIRNYASSPPDTSPPMPVMYTRYGANDADGSHTFPRTWTPDAVVIALGTNDFSYLGVRDPVNPAELVKAMVAFVKKVHGEYPEAQFFLLSSPALGDSYPSVEDAQRSTQIKVLKESVARLCGIKAHFVEWPQQGAEVGCDYHPNAATNAIGAEKLTTAIKLALGW
ncbi:hypothetical protein ACHAQF_005418 [Verticillium nonalfalfae]